MLSIELLPDSVSNHKTLLINSIFVSATTNVLVGEWSSTMFSVVSQLLKHFQSSRGILKNHSINNREFTGANKSDTDSLTSTITKLCVLREDLVELDISFSFIDISLFLYTTIPSDPSLLLRMDNCCVKASKMFLGQIETPVPVVHWKNFILLPFSVDCVTEVRHCMLCFIMH